MIRFQLLSIEHNLLVVVFSKCLGMKFKLNVWDKNYATLCILFFKAKWDFLSKILTNHDNKNP